ncbi:Senescence-specific cysteine protease SAG39 [Linum grandiflorum]
MPSILIKRPVQTKKTIMPSLLQKKTVVSIFILSVTIFILHQAWPTTRHEEDPAAMRERFEEFVSRFRRVYKDAEEKEMRFEIFKANVAEIDAFNAAGGPVTRGINHFADLTTDETRIAMFGHQSYSDRLREFLSIAYSYEGPLWFFFAAGAFFVGYAILLMVYICYLFI